MAEAEGEEGDISIDADGNMILVAKLTGVYNPLPEVVGDGGHLFYPNCGNVKARRCSTDEPVGFVKKLCDIDPNAIYALAVENPETETGYSHICIYFCDPTDEEESVGWDSGMFLTMEVADCDECLDTYPPEDEPPDPIEPPPTDPPAPCTCPYEDATTWTISFHMKIVNHLDEVQGECDVSFDLTNLTLCTWAGEDDELCDGTAVVAAAGIALNMTLAPVCWWEINFGLAPAMAGDPTDGMEQISTKAMGLSPAGAYPAVGGSIGGGQFAYITAIVVS